MITLHIISSLDPSGGGPMEGMRQLVLCLARKGHTVEALTLDDSNAPFLRDLPFLVHAMGPSTGTYRYNRHLIPWLKSNAQRYDAIVVNGLWQFHGLGTWLALRKTPTPYVVYPHGMLDSWFKNHYPIKHLKKWLYWPWAEYRVLRDAHAVLFTSEEERISARKSFWLYDVEERVVDFGTLAPPGDAERLRESFLSAYPHLTGKRTLLFLGRIHEKKGCDLLIKAFASVAKLDPMLHLVMAGPDPMGWGEHLQGLARSGGVADRVHWPGMLVDEMKWGAFYSAEAFVLPSHQENFGIAVAEALGCGVPVLISNKVNIWREIQADAAGLVEDDTQSGTDSLLRQWLAMSPQSRTIMKTRARRCFETRFTVDAMTDSFIRVLEGISIG